MQLGILGLPKSGKTALFNALTASRQATGKFRASNTTNVGVAAVGDRRLEQLRDLYRPKRYVPAQVRFVDVPGIDRGRGETLDLAELRTMDALVHVVRAFEDAELLHLAGDVDPQRGHRDDRPGADPRRLRGGGAAASAPRSGAEEGADRPGETGARAAVGSRPAALEAETSLRRLDFDAEEEKRLRGYGLLSRKPMLLVLNVDEELAGDPDAAAGVDAPPCTDLLAVSARLEEEISRLDPADQGDFLAEAGLDQPSAVRVVQAGYELLGLISFFTVGEDEVRAWTIRRGSTAVTAAGAVHSDIERGFIRAEVTAWRT